MNISYSKSPEEFSKYTRYSLRHCDFNSWQYVHVGFKMEVGVVSTSRVCMLRTWPTLYHSHRQ